MKELVPMNDYGNYEVLIKKSYKLLDENDTNWCDGAFEILKEIDELADCATCPHGDIRPKARDMLHEIALRFGINNLDFCLTIASIYIELQNANYEKDICEYFIKKHNRLLGSEWHIAKRHDMPEHKPDFWVSNGVEDVPVKCKRFDFDEKAKQQLMRYMNVYNCEHGIAVIMELKCELPNNIKFVKINADDLSSMKKQSLINEFSKVGSQYPS